MATSKLQELLAARLAAAVASKIAIVHVLEEVAAPEVPLIPQLPPMSYNEQQLEFIETGATGQSVALTGAAGCGKTTALKGLIARIIQSNRVRPLDAGDHKHLVSGTPGVVMISFTNKAVTNVKKVLSTDMRSNCMTAHKLIEFEPEYYDVLDAKTGNYKTTMRFAPTRNASRMLPDSLQVLIIDEAPMMPVSLWNLVMEAMYTADLQVILIGDLQQLPPVFGKSIFIHAVQRGMKVIELTEVYRQAMGSPIIALATEIVKGKQIPQPRFAEFSRETDKGKVTIQPWKRKLSDIAALKMIGMWLPEQIDKGSYMPDDDIILTPYNEAFGTKAINSVVAGHLAKKLGAEVWEIYSGTRKIYLRIGERVLFQKSEARILDIKRNAKYFGKLPRIPSRTMDYNGIETNPNAGVELQLTAEAAADVDFMLESMGSHFEEGERMSREASHTIKLEIPDLGTVVTVSSSGEISALDLGYALTVHKSQGSEYRKVFFITHASQATMIYRELIYTAVTRAKEELIIVCEPNMFVKGINTQRLPGNNVKEKIAAFERLMAVQKQSDNEMPIKMEVCLRKVEVTK